jgi:hypothetical protein
MIDGRRLVEPGLRDESLLLFLLGVAGFLSSRHYGLSRYPKSAAWLGSVVLIGLGVIAFDWGIILPYTSALTVWISSIALGAQIDNIHLKVWKLLEFVGRRRGEGHA